MASSESSSSDQYHYYVSATPDGDHVKTSKLNFSQDEEALIIRMYNLVGERWSLIAGRIPGRTADEIKSFWMARCTSGGYRKRK